MVKSDKFVGQTGTPLNVLVQQMKRVQFALGDEWKNILVVKLQVSSW